jgi:hypothetical protein
MRTALRFAPLAALWAAAVVAPAVAQSTIPSIPGGTRILIRLEDKLSTAKHEPGKKFKAKTLEPVQTVDGFLLPIGSEIRGHVTRVEPAGLTGRARLWLTFDDIKTTAGRMPLMATVVGVPGDRSVREESREGEIETRTSKGREELEAAAIGAGIGAAAGGVAQGGKGAAIGAAVGAAAGFLIASGMGQDVVLQKGAKIEIELDRPVYLARK